MNKQTLFDTCWQALIDGESLEAIFERFPDQRQELEPMLVAAGQLQAMSTAATPPAFRQSARTRLITQIDSVPQATSAMYGQRLKAWWDDMMTAAVHPRPVWAGAALAMLIAVLILTSTTYASQAAIPGNSLYPLKLMSEQIWLRVATDAPDVDLTLAERRLQEAQLLQTQNRHEAVPETVARYRQVLDDWSERSEMAGTQENQDRVQQRLLLQLQTLQELEQFAPAEQRTMLQEQHRSTEQLLHRFGPPLTPTPQRQPVSTPDPTRVQNTPSGTGHQGAPERASSTPIGHMETPRHQATTAAPDRARTYTPPATATGESQNPTPASPGHQGSPESSPTPEPGAEPQQTPDHSMTPNPGSNPPKHTANPQAQDPPTSEPSPAPEDSPTATPEPDTTPGHGEPGDGSPPTTSPGSYGEQSGGGSQPTTSPAGGGQKGG